MAFMVIFLLVLTIFSAVTDGAASTGLDVCQAGTGTYSPSVVLAFLPPPPGLQARQCVCQLLSPHPLQLVLLHSVSLHPTGDGVDSGRLDIGLGNETFSSTSFGDQGPKTRQCLDGSSKENARTGTTPCLNLTLTFTETGTVRQLFLFQLQPSTDGPSGHSAGNLTIECQGEMSTETTTITTGAAPSSPAPTSHTDLVQMSHSIMAITAVTTLTLLLLLLLLLLLCRRRCCCYKTRKSRVEEDCDKEKVAPESPPAKSGSDSGGRRGERRQQPPPHSVISNYSSDVFLGEDGPQVSGCPPHAAPGGRHASGGKASSTSPITQRHPKASAGSTGDGKGLSPDPRDRARVPSPSPIHRPTATLPALPPSPTTPKPEEEPDEEWYGNLEVEKTIQSTSASLENVYADPDETRAAAASATKVTTKAPVEVVALKGARGEQERKGGADQGKEVPKIMEVPAQTAAPPSPGQTDTTQQPRSRPRTPQSPADVPGSNPRFDLQKQRSREDVKTSPEDSLQSKTPTTGAVPSIQVEEGGQGKTPTSNRSRDASPTVPAKTRGRNKSLDSLDSHADLSLLFPDSGRTSKASIVSQEETIEMAQVDSKEDEEEEVYQNYPVERQASNQEAKKEQAASSPKPSRSSVVLIDNVLYESSTPAPKPGPPKPSRSSVVLIDNELYESSTPAPKSAGSTTTNPFALAMKNELFSLRSAQPAATGPALLVANHSGKTTPKAPQSPVRSDGCVLEDNILYESSADFSANK